MESCRDLKKVWQDEDGTRPIALMPQADATKSSALALCMKPELLERIKRLVESDCERARFARRDVFSSQVSARKKAAKAPDQVRYFAFCFCGSLAEALGGTTSQFEDKVHAVQLLADLCQKYVGMLAQITAPKPSTRKINDDRKSSKHEDRVTKVLVDMREESIKLR